MRRVVPVLALILAASAQAQIAPTPDSPGMGGNAMPSTARPAGAPAVPEAGVPSDVHTTPPATTTQAPPATPEDSAPTETKAKGRAKPSSTAKTPPRG